MNKNYVKVILIFSICMLIGLHANNLFKKEKTQWKNEKIINDKLNKTQTFQEGNNNLKKSTADSKGVISVKKEGDSPAQSLIYNSKSVPVLTYHSIDYEKGNELRIPKEQFREQMKYLKDKGYTTLTFDELYEFLISNKPVPQKSVLITFDDGYKDNYENAYPILKEFGLKGTIFVITGNIDKDTRFLTSAQLRELDKNGIDIESHTVEHERLSELTYNEQLDTLTRSKESLEETLGRQIKYIGYPFGMRNKDTLRAVKDAGYNMAFTTDSGWSNKSQGIYTLHRIYISANHNIREFERRLTNTDYSNSK